MWSRTISMTTFSPRVLGCGPRKSRYHTLRHMPSPTQPSGASNNTATPPCIATSLSCACWINVFVRSSGIHSFHWNSSSSGRLNCVRLSNKPRPRRLWSRTPRSL
ncbi:uncharacterized protein LOC121404586 [Drosophila obscura]|nr:uncharacterized protein LOC121404586 [Drosophila obscura]